MFSFDPIQILCSVVIEFFDGIRENPELALLVIVLGILINKKTPKENPAGLSVVEERRK